MTDDAAAGPSDEAIENALARLAAHPATGDTFEDEVLKSKTPVLVFFWARWCEPCRRMAPAITALADALDQRIRLAGVDTDREEDLARKQSVAGLPTTVLYKNGEAVERVVGVATEGLGQRIEAALEGP